jgi:fluoroacetyl-CoA thioesterase
VKSRKKDARKRAPRRTRNAAKAVLQIKLPVGLEATVERVVTHETTIQHFNPDLPPVFSTPSMIGLMEHATVLAVLPELPPGFITVGTRIEVDHLKAVAPGASVQAWARFAGHKGRFLVFDVEARSGDHVIGRGRVFRAVVNPEEHGVRARARGAQTV